MEGKMAKDIELRDNTLPETITELRNFILIGREKLKAYQAKIRAITMVGMAKEVRDQALNDGQSMGEAVLSAEARLGELLKDIPDYHSSGRGTMKRKTLPDNISKKDSHYAQTIANNTKIVEEVKRAAKAKDEIATKTEVLKQVKQNKKDEKLANFHKKAVSLPEEVYQIIYADPPWQYEHSVSKSREIENQYPTMTLDKICSLPIQKITAKDAVLFLWATNPKLEEALQVIKAWGFEYRTNFVWVKNSIGMGYYARQMHELLLISKRGSLPMPEPKNRASSVINSPKGRHSEKPDLTYEIIEKMYPKCKRIELFARTKHEQWGSWGYES